MSNKKQDKMEVGTEVKGIYSIKVWETQRGFRYLLRENGHPKSATSRKELLSIDDFLDTL